LLRRNTVAQHSQSCGAGKAIYERIATASGTFRGQPASGTAWNEQAL
jgi:hypothetical protein